MDYKMYLYDKEGKGYEMTRNWFNTYIDKDRKFDRLLFIMKIQLASYETQELPYETLLEMVKDNINANRKSISKATESALGGRRHKKHTRRHKKQKRTRRYRKH